MHSFLFSTKYNMQHIPLVIYAFFKYISITRLIYTDNAKQFIVNLNYLGDALSDDTIKTNAKQPLNQTQDNYSLYQAQEEYEKLIKTVKYNFY